MPRQLNNSPQTLRVLELLLESRRSWHYGYAISQSTGLRSGTLYPILKRLHEQLMEHIKSIKQCSKRYHSFAHRSICKAISQIALRLLRMLSRRKRRPYSNSTNSSPPCNTERFEANTDLTQFTYQTTSFRSPNFTLILRSISKTLQYGTPN